MRRAAFIFLICLASPLWAQCTPERLARIEAAALEHDIEPAYAVAIARLSSDCRAHHQDAAGRLGVLGVRPELLGDHLDCPAASLFDPEHNVDAGLDLLARLLEQFGDWERALGVYRSGRQSMDARTRAWVQQVFRTSRWPSMPSGPVRAFRDPLDLDDFGPRSAHSAPHRHTPWSRPWRRIRH
ncbi:transglycosylase SLT domain-containing protein [Wenzhouxiangella marina]|uniref:Uncharacterized protein n=1 Tax=Wenzhouxiangella marina TaxID=1579979 RepID=A0A0K0XUZ1_9GAMM|nr:transglycosylase SLT domain-containing protein [Wenzhouxiangella marina]AKS41442.1 hypothetical protein WM2015_1066 [Wenzhouxiangella marina]MBB6086803.1 soluble lytic murein transglycosylase-like protein [Wenzhouxiangella marina]